MQGFLVFEKLFFIIAKRPVQRFSQAARERRAATA
jgi:hypothetical protein